MGYKIMNDFCNRKKVSKPLILLPFYFLNLKSYKVTKNIQNFFVNREMT